MRHVCPGRRSWTLVEKVRSAECGVLRIPSDPPCCRAASGPRLSPAVRVGLPLNSLVKKPAANEEPMTDEQERPLTVGEFRALTIGAPDDAPIRVSSEIGEVGYFLTARAASWGESGATITTEWVPEYGDELDDDEDF